MEFGVVGTPLNLVGDPVEPPITVDEIGEDAVERGLVLERGLFVGRQLDVAPFCAPLLGGLSRTDPSKERIVLLVSIIRRRGLEHAQVVPIQDLPDLAGERSRGSR